MDKQTAAKKITKKMIYRAVASSTAIETGVSIAEVEKKLKSNRTRLIALALAN